jgi:hypothetical protein
MASTSSDIGSSVTIDLYKPGQSGYKPGVTGKIVGYIVKLDKQIPGVDIGYYQGSPQTHALVSEFDMSGISFTNGTMSATRGGRRRRNVSRKNSRK